MLAFINLPARIVRLFDENVSPSEVAAGVCMGMFLGFIPLNGPMAVVLFLCFIVFKINRLAAILVLPIFKLFYIAGACFLADRLGGILLIDADFLAGFWRWLTHLPVITYLDVNNTLVAGGLVLSAILCIPVYPLSKKGIVIIRERYFVKIKNSSFVKWFKKLPIVNKIIAFVARVREGIR